MNKTLPLLLLVVFFAVAIGLPFGLYALLTRGRRRAVREIRQGAEAQGWQYKLRRWQGNPTAFRYRRYDAQRVELDHDVGEYARL